MHKLNVFVIFVGFAAQLLLATSSYAIPAFSRTYKIECTTCHTIYPELNEYGEAFLKNSYVYFGKSKKNENKENPAPVAISAKSPTASSVSATQPKISGDGDAVKLSKLKTGAMVTGDTATPEVTANTTDTPSAATGSDKAEGLVLAGIPELLPISFTGTINYAYDRRQVNELDFATRSFKLHAGGNFRDKLGFLGTYVAWSEQPPSGNFNTSTTATRSTSEMNELLLSWRHIFDTPLNIRIGRMQPKLGLWKTNNKLSVTNNYLPYTYTVGSVSEFKIEQPQDALELNAILANRFYVAGGIVNRKGQNTKEGYGHASYKFGGADYLANEPDVDLQKEESVLDFLTVTLGSYGYYGKNGAANSNDTKNNYYRVGVDAELLYKIYRLRMLGGYGVDDNATLDFAKTLVRSKAFTIENEITLLTNLIAALRFEFLQQEPNYVTTSFSNYYARRYITTLAYAPLENFKLSGDFKYQIGNQVIDRIVTLGASFSF